MMQWVCIMCGPQHKLLSEDQSRPVQPLGIKCSGSYCWWPAIMAHLPCISDVWSQDPRHIMHNIIPFIHWRWFLCCWFFIVLSFALEAWVNIGKWNIEDWDIVLDTAKGRFCIQEIQCDTCYYYRVNNTRYGYLSFVKNKEKEEKICWKN